MQPGANIKQLAAFFCTKSALGGAKMWDFNEKNRHAKLRGYELARQAIIARVEREQRSNDLSDDGLFLAICLALMEAGYELHDEDQKRLAKIQSRAK